MPIPANQPNSTAAVLRGAASWAVMWPRFRRPPFIGLTAFLVVLLVMPLGHTLMVLLEEIFASGKFVAAGALGLVGCGLLLLGNATRLENPATWLGFTGGILVWTGWVEFSFVYYAARLDVRAIHSASGAITKPEYVLMPSATGLLLATLCVLLINTSTRCSFFLWIQRRCGVSHAGVGPRRLNVALAVFLETIYLLWLFYIALLLLYDELLLGDRHAAVKAACAGFLVWGAFLLARLLRFTRMGAAVRYAIPTVIILWNCVEILGRWKLYTEIWIHPQRYVAEMFALVLALAGAGLLAVRLPESRGAGDALSRPPGAPVASPLGPLDKRPQS